MQDDPRIGLELPLRVLVWERDGTTNVGYRPPQKLAALCDVADRENVLAGMANLLDELVAEAAGREVAQWSSVTRPSTSSNADGTFVATSRPT